MKGMLGADGQRWLQGGDAGDVLRGVDQLTDEDLASLGIPACDAWQTQIRHHDIVSSYRNAEGSSRRADMAPKPEYALQESENWEHLERIDTDSFVDWFAPFSRRCARFGVFLTPLTSVQLACKGYGLAPPGLGLDRWEKMGTLLFDILDRVLPPSVYKSALVESLAQSGASGYDLLWRFGYEKVGIWDPVKPLREPTWPKDDSILTWHRKVKTYRLLSVQRGSRDQNEKTECLMFLRGLASQPRFSSFAAPLLLQVPFTALIPEDGVPQHEWHLPEHHRSDFLAQEIIKLTSDDPADGANWLHPSANLVDAGSITDSQLGALLRATEAAPFPTQPDASDTGQVTDVVFNHLIRPSVFHLQGFVALAHRLRRQGRFGQNRPRDGQDPEQVPTRRRSRERFDGNCDACGRYGHEDIACDFLAMWYHLRKYLKTVDKERAAAAEKRWVEKNKPYLALDARNRDATPSSVAHAFMARNGLTEDELMDVLEREMDWELFEPDGSE